MADDWESHVFSEKELAELRKLTDSISVHVPYASTADTVPEYLQVTALVPMDNAITLVTQLWQIMETGQDHVDAFFTMMGRGLLWQYMTEFPDADVPAEIVSYFLDDWDADNDDSIEFY